MCNATILKRIVVIRISEFRISTKGQPNRPCVLSRSAENGIPIVGLSIPYTPIPARISLRFAQRRVIGTTEWSGPKWWRPVVDGR